MKLIEWGKYDTISNSTFENLYEDELFTDVTLACEGNKKIKAHKIILSVCSNILKEILRDNQHPYPLIYLQGIDSENLVLLKKFMYLGKAIIEQEHFQTFLDMSKTFLIIDTEKTPMLVPNTPIEKHKSDKYDNDSIIDTTPIKPENLGNSVLTENSFATKCVVKVEDSSEEIDSRI